MMRLLLFLLFCFAPAFIFAAEPNKIPEPREVSKELKAEFDLAVKQLALAENTLLKAQQEIEARLAPQRAEVAVANRGAQIVSLKLLRYALKLSDKDAIPKECSLSLDAVVTCTPAPTPPPTPDPKPVK